MADSSFGIAGFFFILAIVVLIIRFCTHLVKEEIDEGSKRTNTRQRSRYYCRHRDGQSTIESSSTRRHYGCVCNQNENTAASPVVVPPYPVDARHPTPHSGPVPAGFATHNPPYPTQNPHPVGAVYYPPPVGAAPYPPAAAPYPPISGAAPYPPTGPSVPSAAPYPDYSANPPSYSEAVGQPLVLPPPSKEGYSKQSPYNPNY